MPRALEVAALDKKDRRTSGALRCGDRQMLRDCEVTGLPRVFGGQYTRGHKSFLKGHRMAPRKTAGKAASSAPDRADDFAKTFSALKQTFPPYHNPLHLTPDRPEHNSLPPKPPTPT